MTTELKTRTRKALSKLRLTKLARSSVKVSEEKGGMGGGDCIGPGKPHSRSGGRWGLRAEGPNIHVPSHALDSHS